MLILVKFEYMIGMEVLGYSEVRILMEKLQEMNLEEDYLCLIL